jgi:hypothetical protein
VNDKFPDGLSKEQIQAIKCVHADLVGALESYNLNTQDHHDWLACLDSIRDLEKVFNFIEPCQLEYFEIQ